MTETSIQTEETLEGAEALSPTAPACGTVLKAAREQKNLTLEDISSRLRLSVHQIKALENDDFSILPSAATMTRGFIRNYARLLEIDAEPLLQVYQAHASGHTNHSLTIKSENILISSTQKPVWKKYIISSLLIVLLIGAWVIYMDYFHVAAEHNTTSLPVAQAEKESALPPITTEPMPEPALPAAERDAAEDVIAPAPAESRPADKPLADNATPAATSAAPATAPASALPSEPTAPVKPVQLPAPAPAANSASSLANSQNQTPPSASVKPALKIRFTFSEPTWVSVLDADNKEVLNKTGQPGSQEKIEVTPPARLVIGNANGTQLEVNNKTIDLAPYNRLNVVRLTLE